jgi:hypothetical protein
MGIIADTFQATLDDLRKSEERIQRRLAQATEHLDRATKALEAMDALDRRELID